MRSTALLFVVLTVGCEASPPTSPDATPDSIAIDLTRVRQASGEILPGAVLSPFTNVTIVGSYFLSDRDIQPIRDHFVTMWVCFGHDAASFRTGCSGEGSKTKVGRILFSASPAAPGLPLDTQFIHFLLMDEPDNGSALLPPPPSGTITSTHYPLSDVVGKLIEHRALEYPIHWQ